jgi:putative oxidoreductase
MNTPVKADQGPTSLLQRVLSMHDGLTGCLHAHLHDWLPGLAARLAFVAVLAPYYLNSALTKPGTGFFGVFAPAAGAFAQILPPVAEQYGYDTSAIPFIPWHVIVILGTITEFVLPVLIVVGLFTRYCALAMMGFIVVQTIVDYAFHGAVTGMLFDNQPTDLLDQRLLWLFVLLILVLAGPGRVSLDAWLRKLIGR